MTGSLAANVAHFAGPLLKGAHDVLRKALVLVFPGTLHKWTSGGLWGTLTDKALSERQLRMDCNALPAI